jgi:diguanylate cyclase (GGDEF)-like protein/putative nucleotidyltransferase with HDIG domain
MRSLSLGALVVSLILIPLAVGVAITDHNRRAAETERHLASEADQHAGSLDAYFLRARSLVLLTAHDAAYKERKLPEVERSLRFLEQLYPGSIGEACFIAADGRELARIVRGRAARGRNLSRDESQNVFFAPTFALPARTVYQAEPYVSPDVHEYVISNSTRVAGSRRAIVHFEVRLEAFRRAAATTDGGTYSVDVADARTGNVVIDGSRPQTGRVELGSPGDRRFARLATGVRAEGVTRIDGHIAAYRRVDVDTHNANHWVVFAIAANPAGTAVSEAGPAPIAMFVVALLLLCFAVLSLRASRRELEHAATTDPLTGLANRRALMSDLARADRCVLMLFDLNGFKSYNDAFGHLAGDALLTRLGRALHAAVAPAGAAYRLGGDEFCVIAPAERRTEFELASIDALCERGDGFNVTTSFGTVMLGEEANDGSEALRIADQRMYAQKAGGPTSASQQSTAVLTRALAERHPDLGDHTDAVAQLTEDVARALGLEREDVEQVRSAGELHDVGKVAIPDAILSKRGPLDEDERAFIRRHTLIGERIISAAPALTAVARLVRSSHERWDGSGYPDRLAGTDIPLGARIVAVCDAYDAIVTDRPYRSARSSAAAIAELRRCAGTQFDPDVVVTFVAALVARHAVSRDAAL